MTDWIHFGMELSYGFFLCGGIDFELLVVFVVDEPIQYRIWELPFREKAIARTCTSLPVPIRHQS